MNRYINRQVNEIKESLVLRIVGCGLGFCYFVSGIYRFVFRAESPIMNQNLDPLCWPSMPFCEKLNILDSEAMMIFGGVYITLSLICAFLFLPRKSVGVAYLFLCLVSVMKLFVYFQSFLFMGNYHYMPLFVTFVFLFVPDKKTSIRFSLVGFYLAAGFLKINREWLSGLAIPDSWLPAHTPAAWVASHGLLPLSCAYVIVLETIFSFGLFSKSRFIFWFCFSQIFIFHIFSYFIVGAYYPVTMLLLLVVFPASQLIKENEWKDETKASFMRSWRPSYTVAVVLALLQCVPRMSPGDAAISGQGRAFSLNMFDALSVCDSKTLVHYTNYIVEASTDSNDVMKKVRKHCDPYVFFAKAKNICKAEKANPDFKSVSLNLLSRRTSDSEFKEVVALENVCDEKITYSIFGGNSWIQK